jgi:hypothetical protein
MFDNLRDEANAYEDKSGADLRPSSSTISGPISRRPSRFLGMSSIQRFVIAVLLMASVCVLGLMVLLVTGKIGIGL